MLKEQLLADVCRKFGLEHERAIAFAYICECCDDATTLEVVHDAFMAAPLDEEDE